MTTKDITRKWIPKTLAPRCHALSLIEVIAATVILGTAVTLLLSLQAVSIERTHAIKNDLFARKLANELYVTWLLESEGQTTSAEGTVPDHRAWSWHRELEPVEVAPKIEAHLVTLTIRRDVNDVGVPDYERTFQWLHPKSQSD